MPRTFYCLAACAVVSLLVSAAAAQSDSAEVSAPQDGDLRVVPAPGVQADGKLLPEELERRLRERLRQLPAEIPPPSRIEGSRTRFLSTDEAARIHFQAADENEDGQLSAQELERLPGTIRELLEARLRRNPEAGISLADVRAALVLLEEENKQRRDAVAPQARANEQETQPLRQNVAQLMERAANTQPKSNTPMAKPLSVQMVLLGRFSEETPVRTLGAEVLTAMGDADGDAPNSLAGRLLPWVGAEENSAVMMLDALQGGTVEGDRVHLQGGIQSTGSMSVGTMATVHASADGEKVWLKVTFEKSFLPQARRSKTAPAQGNEEGDTAAVFGGRGMSSPPSVSISTLQATGIVRVTPGRPVILSEMLQQTENGWQEYVVLIDAAIEAD